MRKKLLSNSLESKQRRMGYLFIMPLIIGCVFVFLPTLFRSFSFCFNEIILIPKEQRFTLNFKGLAYFIQALTVNPSYNKMLTDSLLDMVLDTIIVMIFSILMAIILNQNFKGRTVARIFFFLPVLSLTGIIALVEQDTGVVGSVSLAGAQAMSGLPSSEIPAIYEFLVSMDFNETLINVITSSVSRIYYIISASGIQIYVFLAALQGIAQSLYEAAEVEGCSKWELFWKITLPIISPMILVNTVYTITDTLTKSTNPIFIYTDWLGFGQNQFSLASAMMWIYFLAVGIIVGITMLVISRFVYYND